MMIMINCIVDFLKIDDFDMKFYVNANLVNNQSSAGSDSEADKSLSFYSSYSST